MFGQRSWAYFRKRTRGHDILTVLSLYSVGGAVHRGLVTDTFQMLFTPKICNSIRRVDKMYSILPLLKMSLYLLCRKFIILICFLALLVYWCLENKLNKRYTCEEIVSALKGFAFADVQGQGFIPIYEFTKLTDELHKISGFETDYEFLTKSRMREIQKLSKKKTS